MNREATIAQLKATQMTLTAAHAQLEAQIVALEGDQEADDAKFCPRCRKTNVVGGGGVFVCGDCGANFTEGGDVVAG